MKRIYLIDCPGIVPPSKTDTEEDILLRGVVRVENVEHPAQYVAAVLRRTQTKHVERTYDVKHADYDDDPIEFLSIIARKGGRLLKGGEADVDGVAKMVLNDFLRGKIPWFTPVPKSIAEENGKQYEVVDGRKGKLGEMPGDRKLEDLTEAASSENAETDSNKGVKIDKDDGFESFSDDSSAQEKLLGSDLDDDDADEDADEDTKRNLNENDNSEDSNGLVKNDIGMQSIARSLDT